MTGPALKVMRKRLNLTQKQFAEMIGVTANTVARWERNELRITEPVKRLVTMLTKGTRR